MNISAGDDFTSALCAFGASLPRDRDLPDESLTYGLSGGRGTDPWLIGTDPAGAARLPDPGRPLYWTVENSLAA